MKTSHHVWMEQALSLAEQARDVNEVPVGALIVDEHGKVLGQGFNQPIRTHDPSAHAEIMALRQACQAVHNYRLVNTTLYVTLEPCVMCMGALVHARVKRIVYGTDDPKAGAAGSVFDLTKGFPLNHRIEIEKGYCQEACAALLIDFFKSKR